MRIKIAMLFMPLLCACTQVPGANTPDEVYAVIEPGSRGVPCLRVKTHESRPLFTPDGFGGRQEVDIFTIVLSGGAPNYDGKLTLLDAKDPNHINEMHFTGRVHVDAMGHKVKVEMYGAPGTEPPATRYGPVNGVYRLR